MGIHLLCVRETDRAFQVQEGMLILTFLLLRGLISVVLQGLAAGPEPYTCTITPRPGRKEVVEKELLEAIETFKKFEEGITKDDAEFLANARAAIRVRP